MSNEMKIKKGDYIKLTVIEGVAKVLSDKFDYGERQVMTVSDSGIELTYEPTYIFRDAEPITKEEFDAAFVKTMKFLESVK